MPKGSTEPPSAGRALEAPDARAKLLDTGTVGMGVFMSLATGSEDDMFYICSHSAERVNSESGGGKLRRCGARQSDGQSGHCEQDGNDGPWTLGFKSDLQQRGRNAPCKTV